MQNLQQLIRGAQRTKDLELAIDNSRTHAVFIPEPGGWLGCLITPEDYKFVDHQFKSLTMVMSKPSLQDKLQAALNEIKEHNTAKWRQGEALVGAENLPFMLIYSDNIEELDKLIQIVTRPAQHATTLEDSKIAHMFQQHYWTEQPFDPFDL